MKRRNKYNNFYKSQKRRKRNKVKVVIVKEYITTRFYEFGSLEFASLFSGQISNKVIL